MYLWHSTNCCSCFLWDHLVLREHFCAGNCCVPTAPLDLPHCANPATALEEENCKPCAAYSEAVPGGMHGYREGMDVSPDPRLPEGAWRSPGRKQCQVRETISEAQQVPPIQSLAGTLCSQGHTHSPSGDRLCNELQVAPMSSTWCLKTDVQHTPHPYSFLSCSAPI